MTDSILLRNIIEEKGFKLKRVAEIVGLSPYGLTKKIDNKSEFKTGEINALCDLLDINTLEDKERIFFNQDDDLKSS